MSSWFVPEHIKSTVKSTVSFPESLGTLNTSSSEVLCYIIGLTIHPLRIRCWQNEIRLTVLTT